VSRLRPLYTTAWRNNPSWRKPSRCAATRDGGMLL
jgi:hypothetical protein